MACTFRQIDFLNFHFLKLFFSGHVTYLCKRLESFEQLLKGPSKDSLVTVQLLDSDMLFNVIIDNTRMHDSGQLGITIGHYEHVELINH
jgi:hypothetical protein